MSISSVSSTENEYYDKLQVLKDVRRQTIQMEKLKLAITDNLSEVDQEDKFILEYQQELEILLQEKMAHVEELRLIHTDINTIENLIKQAKQNRTSMLSETHSLHQTYLPMKESVNELRETIGLENVKDAINAIPNVVSNGTDENKQHDLSQEKVMKQEVNDGFVENEMGDIPTSSIAHSTIRQQPPPMKSCQSCHQMIHRNAPICPLCKAKSRSRNPKKPKRR